MFSLGLKWMMHVYVCVFDACQKIRSKLLISVTVSFPLLKQVQAAIDGAKSDKNIHQLLQKIKDCPNIPRKQAKFKVIVSI